tara:strand:+ start:131 stop:349 length:219 start_codon:yes stop_codon:yes gene_type:complete
MPDETVPVTVVNAPAAATVLVNDPTTANPVELNVPTVVEVSALIIRLPVVSPVSTRAVELVVPADIVLIVNL